MNRFLTICLILCFIAALLFTILFGISTWTNFDFAGKKVAAWDQTGQLGDFVGRVIGTLVTANGSVYYI
jgi:hypothetical protein